jgi:hypothetical protein
MEPDDVSAQCIVSGMSDSRSMKPFLRKCTMSTLEVERQDGGCKVTSIETVKCTCKQEMKMVSHDSIKTYRSIAHCGISLFFV